MSERHRVLVAEPLGAAGADRLRADPDVDAVFAQGQSRPELLESMRDAAALIVRSGSLVDAELIAAGPGLRVIGRAGVGVDNIDLAAAAERGIAVVNTPEANTLAAAEHAFALMLATARRVTEAHNSLAAGNWDRKQYLGVQLAGATLGLVGFGRIGRAVGHRALAFEMAVLATDPYIPAEMAQEHGAKLVELDELLAASDFVSLHAVALPGRLRTAGRGRVRGHQAGRDRGERGPRQPHRLRRGPNCPRRRPPRRSGSRRLRPGAPAARPSPDRPSQSRTHPPSGRQHQRSPARRVRSGSGQGPRRPQGPARGDCPTRPLATTVAAGALEHDAVEGDGRNNGRIHHR